MMGLTEQGTIDNSFVLPIEKEDEAGVIHFVQAAINQSPSVGIHLVFAYDVSDAFVDKIYARYGNQKGIKFTRLLLTDDPVQHGARLPKTFFVTLFELGKVIPADFNKQLNTMFVDYGQRYLVLRPKEGYHGLVALSHVHKYLPMETVTTLDKNVLEWTEWNQELL